MKCPHCGGTSYRVTPDTKEGNVYNRKCYVCGRPFCTFFVVDMDEYPELYKFLLDHAKAEGRHPAIQLIDNVRIIKENFRLP